MLELESSLPEITKTVIWTYAPAAEVWLISKWRLFEARLLQGCNKR